MDDLMGRYGTPIFRFVNIHGLGCQIQIPVPFANKDSNAIHLQATVDATTCVPGLRHLAAYEMISPRTARAERRRETKTHCCIAGVKTKGKRHGRP